MAGIAVQKNDARMSLTLAAALACVLVTTGCMRDTPESLIASANSYVAKGDHNAAVLQLKTALQKAPNVAEARYLLGASLLEMGDPASAEKELRKALELKHPPEKVYPLLGRALIEQGEYKKVLSEFGSLSLDTPAATAELKAVLGAAHYGLRQPSEAKAAYAEALKLRPGFAPALLGEATLTAAQDLAGALAIVEGVLAKEPNDADALFLKTRLLSALNRPQEAIKPLEKLVELKPARMAPRNALASLLVAERQYDAALAQVAAMRKLAPRDPRVSYLQALVAVRQGKMAEARDPVAQVLKVAPDYVPALVIAAQVEMAIGSHARAEAHLRKVVERNPTLLLPRLMLTQVLLRRGETSRAAELLQPALKAAPNDYGVLMLAGEAALANNQIPDATRYFEAAAKVDKNSVAAKTQLAQTWLAAGDTERAVAALRDASAMDPLQYQPDLVLIAAHLRQKEPDKAMAAWQALEKKQPNNPQTYNLHGAILLAKEDVKSARASFERALSIQPTFVAAIHNLAQLDLRDKQPEAARKRYEALLVKDPNNVQGLLALASLKDAARAPAADVIAILRKAVAGNPTSEQARMTLVAALLKSGDKKAGLTAAQEAAAALPESVLLADLLGQTQLLAGERAQALATFNKLAALAPKSPTPLLRVAAAHAAAKDLPATVQALRRALAIAPDMFEAQRAIASTLLAAGKPDQALVEVRNIQRHRPKDAIGWIMEGDLHSHLQKWNEAEKAYRSALTKSQASLVITRLHATLVSNGKPAEADGLAAKWSKEHPDDMLVPLYMAQQDMSANRYAAAVERYKALLVRQPGNAVILNNLAWAAGEIKDPKALEYAEAAFKLAPENPAILDTLGWILVSGKEDARGIDLLRKAVDLAPQAGNIRLHLAKALLKTGDKGGARKELETLVKNVEAVPSKDEAAALLKTL